MQRPNVLWAHAVSSIVSGGVLTFLVLSPSFDYTLSVPEVKAVRVSVMSPLSSGLPSQDLSNSVPIEAPRFVPDTVDAPKLNKDEEVAKTVQDAPARNTDEILDLQINPEIIVSPDNEISVSQLRPIQPTSPDESQTDLGLPPVPDEFTIPIEVFDPPNQGVLVLGLLLNDEGVVQDVRILVPSGDTAYDLIVALRSKGLTYPSIVPPIERGTQRWIPLRMQFTQTNNPYLP